MTNKAYDDGFTAGFEGREVSSNPYSLETENFNAWDVGHVDGERWADENDCDMPSREDDYDDSMDGDFDSAMTSAGFGTDEDYGDYGYDDDGRWDE